MNKNEQIAEMAAQICHDNHDMNPLTVIFAAMQALDPRPGAKMVVESVEHRDATSSPPAP